MFIKAKEYPGTPEIYWVEQKLDGHRRLALPGKTITHSIGKYSLDYGEKPSLHEEGIGPKVPDGWEVDGEIVTLAAPIIPGEYIQCAPRGSPGKKVFVAWVITNRDLTFIGHKRALESAGFLTAPAIGTMTIVDEGAALLALAADRKLEGWILKETPLAGWWKLKIEHTIELRIGGCVRGKGKYHNTLGAIVCYDGRNEEVATCGGMTDEMRHDIWENWEEYKDQICEVKYQMVGSRGRLIHPRFVCMRPDRKDAQNVS